MGKEELEAKGYTFEKYEGMKIILQKDDEKEVLVRKDGLYGLIDKATGAVITPCVHASKEDAYHDLISVGATRDKYGRPQKGKQVSVQKILKDGLGDELYDPYVGKITRTMLDVLAIPNSVEHLDTHRLSPLDEEQTVKAALRIYESIAAILNKGGKKLVIYSYGETPEFLDYCRELEKMTNGDFLYHVRYHYDDLTPEDYDKYWDENNDYPNQMRKYINFEPALSQLIHLRKFNGYSVDSGLSKQYHEQKPAIDIGPEGTVYYEDLHRPDNKVVISKEVYRKGVQLETPEEGKTPRKW